MTTDTPSPVPERPPERLWFSNEVDKDIFDWYSSESGANYRDTEYILKSAVDDRLKGVREAFEKYGKYTYKDVKELLVITDGFYEAIKQLIEGEGEGK